MIFTLFWFLILLANEFKKEKNYNNLTFLDLIYLFKVRSLQTFTYNFYFRSVNNFY
jgi:hypothetical protein